MAKLKWDETGSRFYETGIDNGVLYLYDDVTKSYPEGVAWNGLTSISENPSGADANAIWADNIKYLNLIANEDFGATIEAYTYPDEFAECDGSAATIPGVMVGQQARKMFGLCYRTRIGNDTAGDSLGYKLHLVYGCKASPSSKSYNTVNDSPEAMNFSWEIATQQIEMPAGLRPSATIVIDSTKFTDPTAKGKLDDLLEKLYGTDGDGSTAGTDAYLPLPSEVFATLQ